MDRRAIVFAIAMCLLCSALTVVIVSRQKLAVFAETREVPAYAPNGDLMPPKNYREWIYLSTGIDMSYSPNPATAAQSVFDNVFVNPSAYRSFLTTGRWPDKTVMVLEVRGAESKGSINQHGHFQSAAIMGMEVHVKDEARFPGKWAFFEFDSPENNGTLFPQKAPCYTCHAAHAAVDTTFVQFYPTLLPIAKQKKTLSAQYLKDQSAAAAN